MFRKRIGIAVAIAVVVSAGAVGFTLTNTSVAEAGAKQSDTPRSEATISMSEMPDALRAAIDAFPYELPGSQPWPDAAQLYQNSESDMIENGVADITVALYWQCAWSGAVLSAGQAENSEEVLKGISELERWGSLPAVEQWVSSSDVEAWKRTELEPALAGDFTNMRTAHGGCAGFGFK